MSTLFVALACAIALVALPHLLVRFFFELANSLGMLSGMVWTFIKRILTLVYKSVVWVLKLPLNFAKELVMAMKEWRRLFMKGVDSNKKRNQFREAVKNKRKRHKLANRYDEIFYEARTSLQALEAQPQSSSTAFSCDLDKEFSELNIPTFLRKGIYQVDHEGKLLRDKNNLPIKTTVASMFSSAEDETEIVEPTILNPNPVVHQSSLDQAVDNDIPESYPYYLDDDGFEPGYDPTLYL